MAVALSSPISTAGAGETVQDWVYPSAFGRWNLPHGNYKTIKISIFSLPEAEC